MIAVNVALGLHVLRWVLKIRGIYVAAGRSGYPFDDFHGVM